MPDQPAPIHPYHCFHVAISPSPWDKAHTHEAHEFFFCTHGGGQQRADDRRIRQRPGDLFLFPAGQPHYCVVDEPRGCRGIVFNVLDSALPQEMETASVARRVLRRLCERAFEGQNAVRLSDAGQRTLGELFEQMAGENQRQSAGHTAAISIAYQSALLTILRDPQTAPWFQEDVRPSSAEDRLVNVLRYLEHHAADELSVEEMARMACMSRSHFHACFRETTGYAPLEYVNRLRIRTAERLLRETDRSIAEIAHGCGFPSLSHFYHLFGRVVGRTPRQARLATA